MDGRLGFKRYLFSDDTCSLNAAGMFQKLSSYENFIKNTSPVPVFDHCLWLSTLLASIDDFLASAVTRRLYKTMMADAGSQSRGKPQNSPRTQRFFGGKRLGRAVLGKLVCPAGLAFIGFRNGFRADSIMAKSGLTNSFSDRCRHGEFKSFLCGLRTHLPGRTGGGSKPASAKSRTTTSPGKCLTYNRSSSTLFRPFYTHP